MRAVVTEASVRAALADGAAELRVPEGAIVTDLARELAGRRGIRLTTGVELPSAEAANHGPFVEGLVERARRLHQHIVLCEGSEERVLRAADRVLHARMARLTLLGDEAAVRRAAERAGVDIAAASIVDPATSEHAERFAEEYARLRAHKGVTLDDARGRVRDVSYFGTMMVQLGLADGMVSGAVHTTAETIRPALEIIKTQPGVASVSSVFLLVLGDQVFVAGDCAVNPQPTPAQLAEIAVNAAGAAVQFGVDPRVAMLSYSTGTSGSGPAVDAVVEATSLAKEAAPHLVLEGPLQYDAAVDPVVGKRKLPGSKVAGKATVLIFPDLNSGNIAYKAVQQSGGALAIGPMLLGLRKPVNDLSRSATVDDIVNTVVATAIQAGG
ncbi:phosphate acetyltransferase [Tessaracoccus lapidicaptus]|uniref:Phosphate acetyltransferase n=1 Tax=Tessaracoccus lapidicaptus TaxID=1427523 RepID=A0A1C0AKD1_9ACTN|nr:MULTISPECIES: phosphate acetyltransferase [Tessaracoccus]AQX16857.1 phosphate acetyltransferase [Tessaracoccus sp. T2.5-30]OCL33081.1 phosphate acetyltransferase [Tessaracoccus lapidicaptus]VEP41646.1 Phosphate acetyltransferase [Tessaracoccus lapidicaptus]